MNITKTWRDKTTADRVALRRRRKTRRARKEANARDLWATKRERARGALDLAAFEWDRARKAIATIPDLTERGKRARALTTLLAGFNTDHGVPDYTTGRR